MALTGMDVVRSFSLLYIPFLVMQFNVGGELVDDEEDAGGAIAGSSSASGALGGAPGSAGETLTLTE